MWAPPSGDLPAHLLRAHLFSAEGFGIWNNWWYGGHHVLLYSVLFPAAASVLGPQLAAALAAIATAALFEQLAYGHWGERALAGSLWFAAGTAASLYAGRLTFAFGLLPATAAVLALEQRRWIIAAVAGAVTALCSPVAALLAALAGAADVGARLRSRAKMRTLLPGTAVVLATVVPLLALEVGFPEGGTEPFAVSAFLPLPVIGIAAFGALPRTERTLRLGALLYTGLCVAAFWIPSALGGNVVRLGELAAGPLAALLWWRRRPLLLAAVAIPLIYLQFQAPLRDLLGAVGNPSASAGYYQPLVAFLDRQHGSFRVEIPFTRYHWESYEVGRRFPLARGWERQLDISDNSLFYRGPLTPATYRRWLDRLAVRFVALPDTQLDYSAAAEARLIAHGSLPYLTLVHRTAHWRIYLVRGAAPVAQGAASATAMGANWLELRAQHPGRSLVRVRFTPYWTITQGSGCVGPGGGGLTTVSATRAGPIRLSISFSVARIRATSPRCR